MSQQRHVIKRQTVEISLGDREAAWPIQQTLSRIFQQHFPAILDLHLSELSTADCLHRIDCLELDLGELDSNRLEDDILERIDATLREALRGQTGNTQSQQHNETTLAHLQLFEHFVREGYLPWWADNTQSLAPEKSFTALLNSAPNALANSLIKLIQEPRCLHRLISYFDDDRLIAMMALLTGSTKDLVSTLLLTLQAIQAPLHQLSAAPDYHIKSTLWQSLLQVTIANEPIISHHAEFLSAVIVRWARLQGLTDKILANCLQQLLTSAPAIDNEWLKAIRLSTPIALTPVTFTANNFSSSHAIFKRRRSTHRKQAKLPDELSPIDPMTYPRKPTLATISNRYPMLKQRFNTDPEQTHKTIATDITTNNNQTFSDTDTLYINNAGLCLLWPYLGTFFEGLELMQNSRFHNQAAQQCAVSLLHYLATGELDPPEYLLPFNKLLCAMEIEEVFDLLTPLTTAQIEAGDELLSAVIGNVPILNNMSHNSFRGSFLLRQGSLSADSGCWLLRVERETYDLVLDRFPWTWQWFKLPWMDHPIRVEW